MIIAQPTLKGQRKAAEVPLRTGGQGRNAIGKVAENAEFRPGNPHKSAKIGRAGAKCCTLLLYCDKITPSFPRALRGKSQTRGGTFMTNVCIIATIVIYLVGMLLVGFV